MSWDPAKNRELDAYTLKLDGQRTAIVCRQQEAVQVTALHERSLGRLPEARDFVLDAEEHAGIFWVFDALMIGGADVRGLSLADRLRLLQRLLDGTGGRLERGQLRAKPFYAHGSLALLSEKIEEARGGDYDGLIFASLGLQYEAPPVKWKPCLTVDFAIENARDAPREGRYLLLTELRGELRPFYYARQKCQLTLTRERQRELSLPAFVTRESKIVLECSFSPDTQTWSVLRRRFDRQRPNCLKTVLDTLQLASDGQNSDLVLLGGLAPVSEMKAFGAWRQALLRRLLWSLQHLRVPTQLSGWGGGGSGGGAQEDLLVPSSSCSSAPSRGAEEASAAVIVYAFPDAPLQEVLAEAVASCSHTPGLEASLLVECQEESLLLPDEEKGGMAPPPPREICSSRACKAADLLLRRARQTPLPPGFSASVLPLEPRGASELFGLGPELQRRSCEACLLLHLSSPGGYSIFEALAKVYESVSLA